MGFITCHAGGVYEHVSRLMSYEGLCYALIDNPELFAAVTEKLGNIIYDYTRQLLQIENISAIFQDEVLPITEAKKLYGSRISLLGGADIDKLTRFEPEELRKYIRDIINKC